MQKKSLCDSESGIRTHILSTKELTRTTTPVSLNWIRHICLYISHFYGAPSAGNPRRPRPEAAGHGRAARSAHHHHEGRGGDRSMHHDRRRRPRRGDRGADFERGRCGVWGVCAVSHPTPTGSDAFTAGRTVAPSCTVPSCTAPRRAAPSRTAPHRTAPHKAAASCTAPAQSRTTPSRTALSRTPHRTEPHLGSQSVL